MTTTIPAERAQLTALRGAWLFDGTGPALIRDPVVLIEGSVIRDVCSGGRVPETPGGSTVIDLPGATLLPGLVDTHVHLAFDASADPVGNLARRRGDEIAATMAEAGRAALCGGVTTVRDLGDHSYLSLGLRGQAGLPTVVAACASTPAGEWMLSRSWPAAGTSRPVPARTSPSSRPRCCARPSTKPTGSGCP